MADSEDKRQAAVISADELGDRLEQLKVQDDNTQPNVEVNSNNRKCPVCQDTVVHPISLPCEHTFCYLCLKGVFARSGSCALCRKPIPPDLVAKPESLTELFSDRSEQSTVHWMYEGRREGWWLYEKRLSDEIEEAFKNDKSRLKIQISGFLYIVDFEQMVQYRIEKPDRRRRITRETTTDVDYKGVAGIPVLSTVVKENHATS